MSRKTPARFDDANEEFYAYVNDMRCGDRVVLEGRVFVLRQDGSLRFSYDLYDCMFNCTSSDCSLWEEIPRSSDHE